MKVTIKRRKIVVQKKLQMTVSLFLGFDQIAEILIEKGADVNIVTNDETALIRLIN